MRKNKQIEFFNNLKQLEEIAMSQREWEEAKPIIKWTILTIFILLIVIGTFKSIRIVQPGYVGVSVFLGTARDSELTEGIHFVAPFLTQVHSIDTRIQKAEVTGNEAASRDLQTVTSSIIINYHLERTQVVDLFRNIGIRYESIVIMPGTAEVFKAVTARFTAEELITQRQEVSQQMREILETRLADYGIIVTQVNVVSFNFSREFDAAIEQKVVAEQAFLRAENELLRVEVEAKQAIAKAEGEAGAILAKAEAEAESMRMRLEYAKPQLALWEAINRWNGDVPQTLLIGEGGVMPMFNIKD